MLSRLQVKNFVLIDSLEIDFPEGLVIITGQTGAGKSILLGALSLVMGSKADAGMLSDGAENCVVEAEFEAAGLEEGLLPILEENDIDWDGGHLILRRVVNRSGRSRAFVNDSPVPLQVLQNISSRLIDIHSQHQTLLLADRQFQLSILDHFAGNSQLLNDCAEAWRNLGRLRGELEELDRRIAAIERDRDYNEAQFRQLDAAALRSGELEELEQEQKSLANAEEIKTALCSVEAMYDASASQDGLSMDASLKEAFKQLNKVSKYLPAAEELARRIDSCRLELEDIVSEVSSLNDGTLLSESRLEEVEARMSLIYSLMTKHSCANEAELIALRDSLSENLADSTILLERREALSKEISKAESVFDSFALALRNSRQAAAKPFARSIEESIRSLELPYAVFDVALSESAPSSTGTDTVIFRFSANNTSPVELSKCASGGELSRIMLSLKAMIARFTQMPTMIFDEIDTGVSGSVADKIGSMVCGMGRSMQVFAITHLPQVAAKGDAHYLVSKEMKSGHAVSTITRIQGRERVLEVARMLSGSHLTDAAIANAEALLKG